MGMGAVEELRKADQRGYQSMTMGEETSQVGELGRPQEKGALDLKNKKAASEGKPYLNPQLSV